MIIHQLTAPRDIRGVAQALTDLERLDALALPTTREDDWALTRAIQSLREIVGSNALTEESSP